MYEYGDKYPKSPDPGLDPDPDPKSQLPWGLFAGDALEVMSIVNFPPVFELMVEVASVAAAEVAGRSSNR